MSKPQPPAEKRVHVTTVRASSGKPITSFLDYSPRTLDPPSQQFERGMTARPYADYLAEYDLYLAKFFQVRQQFKTLLREVPEGDLLAKQKALRNSNDVHLIVPQAMPAPRPAPSEAQVEARKGRKRAARRRQRKARALRKAGASLAEAKLDASVAKAKLSAAKSEASLQRWETVSRRKATRAAVRRQNVPSQEAPAGAQAPAAAPNRAARRYAIYGPPRS
jgi:hypothetical protein